MSALNSSVISLFFLGLAASAQAGTTADIDGNGCLNAADVECYTLSSLAELNGKDEPTCQAVSFEDADITNDGQVTVVDVVRISKYIEATGGNCDCSADPDIGDVNADCSLTQADANCVLDYIMSNTVPECVAVPETSLDFNQDGSVDVHDYMLLAVHLSK